MQILKLYDAWQLTLYGAWSNVLKQSKIITICKIDKVNLRIIENSQFVNQQFSNKSLYWKIEHNNK